MKLSAKSWLIGLTFIQPLNCQRCKPHGTSGTKGVLLDTLLEQYVSNYSLPGIGAFCAYPWDSDQSVAGNRYYGNDAYRVGDDDTWHLGSNTKAMTATVVAILIEKGLLSWTSTLKQLFPNQYILGQYADVTVELLLSHRSGISDDAWRPTWSTYFDIDDPVVGRQSMMNATLATTTDILQGTYHYSNANYVIAGKILDHLCGSDAEQCMQDNLFGNLNMTVGLGPNVQNYPEILEPWPHSMSVVPDTVTPWAPDQLYGTNDNPPGMNTAGRAHMSLSDYRRFVDIHLAANQGMTSPALNLSLSGFDKLHTAYPAGGNGGYAYGGWLRTDLDDAVEHYQLAHAGSNTWNYCITVINSLEVGTTAVCTNIAGGQTENIVDQLASALISQSPPPYRKR